MFEHTASSEVYVAYGRGGAGNMRTYYTLLHVLAQLEIMHNFTQDIY
jgi:hypothetical protein